MGQILSIILSYLLIFGCVVGLDRCENNPTAESSIPIALDIEVINAYHADNKITVVVDIGWRVTVWKINRSEFTHCFDGEFNEYGDIKSYVTLPRLSALANVDKDWTSVSFLNPKDGTIVVTERVPNSTLEHYLTQKLE